MIEILRSSRKCKLMFNFRNLLKSEIKSHYEYINKDKQDLINLENRYNEATNKLKVAKFENDKKYEYIKELNVILENKTNLKLNIKV